MIHLFQNGPFWLAPLVEIFPSSCRHLRIFSWSGNASNWPGDVPHTKQVCGHWAVPLSPIKYNPFWNAFQHALESIVHKWGEQVGRKMSDSPEIRSRVPFLDTFLTGFKKKKLMWLPRLLDPITPFAVTAPDPVPLHLVPPFLKKSEARSDQRFRVLFPITAKQPTCRL